MKALGVGRKGRKEREGSRNLSLNTWTTSPGSSSSEHTRPHPRARCYCRSHGAGHARHAHRLPHVGRETGHGETKRRVPVKGDR